jgi:hypothetical protein
MRSHRLARRTWMERKRGTTTSGSLPLATVHMCKFYNEKVVIFRIGISIMVYAHLFVYSSGVVGGCLG